MSAVSALHDVIEAAIEAITPPSRTEVLYRRALGQNLSEGSSGDRVFWIDHFTQRETKSDTSNQLSVVEWSFPLHVRFNLDAYGHRSGVLAVSDEVDLIVHTIDCIPEASLPNGSSVVCGEATPTHQKNALIATIQLSIWLEETY